MSKLKLSTPNGQIFCQLLTNNNGAIHVNGGMLGTQANPSILININDVTVLNNHHLTIVNSDLNIAAINLLSGTVELNNSYIDGGPATDVVIGDNSILSITGTDLCINSLTVNLNSTLKFTHNGHNYTLQTPSEIGAFGNYNAAVIVQNFDKLITICEFINDKWKTNIDFAPEEICYLRDYQKLDSNFVSLFMNQNGMVDTHTIDYFIAQNYFELTGICHDANLTGSTLEGCGPYNITEQISSWLDLDDVKLFGDAGEGEGSQ